MEGQGLCLGHQWLLALGFLELFVRGRVRTSTDEPHVSFSDTGPASI